MPYLSRRAPWPTQLAVHAAALAVSLLASGCLYVGWDDVPSAEVRADIDARYLANTTFDNAAYWHAEVAHAIATWNAAAAGCAQPFTLTSAPAAHPIRLVPRDAWPYAGDIVGRYVDEYADDEGIGYILIRERRPADASHVPVLLHELGHAIGLTHDDDPSSVMHERVKSRATLHARDIRRMRDALGC